jgi:hypothetical protein
MVSAAGCAGAAAEAAGAAAEAGPCQAPISATLIAASTVIAPAGRRRARARHKAIAIILPVACTRRPLIVAACPAV